MIVKPGLTKDDAANVKQKQKEEQKQLKDSEDKRNINMSKEGLLNEHAWINPDKNKLSQAQSDLRQRLHVAKQKALNASTNLFVSKTRLQIRNLPRREFFEEELK